MTRPVAMPPPDQSIELACGQWSRPGWTVPAEPLATPPPLLAWYRQQAQGGASWAQAWVGRLHEAGQWVPEDQAAAAYWYRQAGQPAAQNAERD